MEDGFIEINNHFTSLYEEADNKDDFTEQLLTKILTNIDYSDDLKINEFIKFTIESYTYYFQEIQEKSNSDIKTAAINEDKRLKVMFLKEVKYNINMAIDTLCKKNILYHHYDETIKELNNLSSKSISYRNIHSYIIKDIDYFLDLKKVRKKSLSKYLRDEIISRVKKNTFKFCFDTEIELNTFIKQEKEFIYQKLCNQVENKESTKEFWDKF